MEYFNEILKKIDNKINIMSDYSKDDPRTVVIFSHAAAESYKKSDTVQYDKFIQLIQDRLPQDGPYTGVFDDQVTKFAGEIYGESLTGMVGYIDVFELIIVEVTCIWSTDLESRPQDWAKYTATSSNLIDDVLGGDDEFYVCNCLKYCENICTPVT